MMSDLYDSASPASQFGPVFIAEYRSDCPSCFDDIEPGDRIRADGTGEFIHARRECEEVAAE